MYSTVKRNDFLLFSQATTYYMMRAKTEKNRFCWQSTYSHCHKEKNYLEGEGGDTSESNRSKCYREHQYKNLLTFQHSSPK